MSNHRLNNLKKNTTTIERTKAPIIRLGVYAAVAANLVTALAGAGAFCIYLWTVHANYVKERDPNFTAHWTNFAEGCIDCPVDENNESIKLNIGADNGHISGEIYIDDPFNEKKAKPKKKQTMKEILADLMKGYTNYFLVEGELTFHHGKISFYDFREGKKVYFGEANIKLLNNSLYFNALDGSFPTIPKKVVFSTEIEGNESEQSETNIGQD